MDVLFDSPFVLDSILHHAVYHNAIYLFDIALLLDKKEVLRL